MKARTILLGAALLFCGRFTPYALLPASCSLCSAGTPRSSSLGGPGRTRRTGILTVIVAPVVPEIVVLQLHACAGRSAALFRRFGFRPASRFFRASCALRVIGGPVPRAGPGSASPAGISRAACGLSAVPIGRARARTRLRAGPPVGHAGPPRRILAHIDLSVRPPVIHALLRARIDAAVSGGSASVISVHTVSILCHRIPFLLQKRPFHLHFCLRSGANHARSALLSTAPRRGHPLFFS